MNEFWLPQDLKDYVRQAGDVTYGDAHRPTKGEGYGDVMADLGYFAVPFGWMMWLVFNFRVLEFATHSDARIAIRKLDGTTLNGKTIRLIDVSYVTLSWNENET